MESNQTRKMESSSLNNLPNEIYLKIFNFLNLDGKYSLYINLKKNNDMSYIDKHLKIKLNKENLRKSIYYIKKKNKEYINFIYSFTKNDIILKYLFVFGEEDFYIPFIKSQKLRLSSQLYISLYNESFNKESRNNLTENYLQNKNITFYNFINNKK